MSDIHRVVFDTSTLVSAALRVGSIPHQALAQALATCEVCASASTLLELEQVLMRAKFNPYQPIDLRVAFVALMRKHGAMFAVSANDELLLEPKCRDPKDNQFLALALTCEADVLVSSDADLLVLDPWHGVPIVTPGAFLLLQH